MEALRARLGCRSSYGGRRDGGHASAPPPPSAAAASSSSCSSSRLGDRARSSAELALALAGLCAKETGELTMVELKLLLAAVRRAGEEARRRRGRKQRAGDGDRNEFDLFCSVEPPEALQLGRAKALQQAAAAGLRLL